VDDARTDAPCLRAQAIRLRSSSTSARSPATRTTKGIFPYAVSKAGVNQATRVMALEGAKYNVRVNALAPGYNLHQRQQSAARQRHRAPNSSAASRQRRLGEFTDLDGPLLLLASDASRYMTGSIVVVDGATR